MELVDDEVVEGGRAECGVMPGIGIRRPHDAIAVGIGPGRELAGARIALEPLAAGTFGPEAVLPILRRAGNEARPGAALVAHQQVVGTRRPSGERRRPRGQHGDMNPVRARRPTPGANPTMDFLLSRFCKFAKPKPVKTHVGAISFRLVPHTTPARFSTFALRAGTPNSLRQTSASAATPARMVSCEGCAKHNRIRLLPWALSVDHSGPGLSATPAARAAAASFWVSTWSGSLTQRKMPPFGSSNSAAVPNCSASASIRASSLPRSPRV